MMYLESLCEYKNYDFLKSLILFFKIYFYCIRDGKYIFIWFKFVLYLSIEL